MRALAIVIAAALAACGSFEEPSIVLDLRVIAMRTEIGDSVPPKADQVLDVDTMQGVEVEDWLAQLQATNVIAWIADPGEERELFWTMRLCLPDDDERCDLSEPHQELGASIMGDPETAATAQRPLATVIPDFTTVAMLIRAIQKNPVDTLGGVDLIAELTVGGVDAPREEDIIATKKLHISPRIPVQRSENTNPSVNNMETALNGAGGIGLPGGGTMTPTRCADLEDGAKPVLEPGDALTLFPNETAGTREVYVVPGLDGSPITIEESVSYQWLATYGSWSDETTGGGHDILGNQSLLGSDWTAPSVGSGGLDVTLWMIQRDERFGVTPFETCIRVER